MCKSAPKSNLFPDHGLQVSSLNSNLLCPLDLFLITSDKPFLSSLLKSFSLFLGDRARTDGSKVLISASEFRIAERGLASRFCFIFWRYFLLSIIFLFPSLVLIYMDRDLGEFETVLLMFINLKLLIVFTSLYFTLSIFLGCSINDFDRIKLLDYSRLLSSDRLLHNLIFQLLLLYLCIILLCLWSYLYN
jgi:hypothetical protein